MKIYIIHSSFRYLRFQQEIPTIFFFVIWNTNTASLLIYFFDLRHFKSVLASLMYTIL